MKQFFKLRNKDWDGGEKDSELSQQEAAVNRDLEHLKGDRPPVQSAGRGRGMAALRQKATDDCLQNLDRTLAQLTLSGLNLPSTQSLDPFGQLDFTWVDQATTQIEIRLRLNPGLLVDRAAILAHDQRLWSAYTRPSSLAILLLPQMGDPLLAEGPRVDGEDLAWSLPAAQLQTGQQYQPRLDAFVGAEDKEAFRYAIGQAASSEGGVGALEPPSLSPYKIACFSAQAEGEQLLVLGLEGQAQPGAAFDFAAFKQYLFAALEQDGISYTPDAQFPSSGRLYLQIDPADKAEVEACLARLNNPGQPQ